MQLHVHVVEASNITKVDFLNASDLYMTIQLSTSSAIQQTNVILNTQSPIWNQIFHFGIIDQGNTVMRAIVKNRVPYSDEDRPIAILHIPLGDLALFEIRDKWYDLQPLVDSNNGGSVHIILQIAPAAHPAFQPQMINFPPRQFMPNMDSAPNHYSSMGPQQFGQRPAQIGQRPMANSYVFMVPQTLPRVNQQPTFASQPYWSQLPMNSIFQNAPGVFPPNRN
ncbi:C2 domain containing protein [Histomonas meleagridis]|uniref:C2 domain containing protein n=1 Tax=Histomonas meleagridis TaxID=135588 RepID=UPI00355A2807|nr:C2 domain containing protein [Histomonas meleagridis]KAH0801818.1 C2 domain containing protein [Histomonas meleagridis]